ncbi:hypothetical protein F3157_11415 [Virgibacillus dakarensis]|uniref:Uncharacterized protein n=1 Tax=Lentibacillus populi TaxID=1827502 RepID=A0A9W5TZ96_9BACI|nr:MULTISPECIES: type II toxin-antitoxin system PemK/MazF family toxin [Bacillaceae]MBT2218662.1 type II toxin-antitoxin system PemK/MazF family toxin [Virgibacillus dakarensis]MTW86261.1 hypothetical protein [Virgibacillus dakarensis]GGB50325.1 hypothetical protein GCM10011409_29910 [Lentibacillus populi]
MEPGHIYRLDFPYEFGQGYKNRPVLIIVVNTDYGKAVGLKITGNGDYEFREEIKNSPDSNLTKQSFVQYDRYSYFDNQALTPVGKLSEDDFKNIVHLFLQYHQL